MGTLSNVAASSGTSATGSTPIDQYMAQQVNNPTLTPSTTMNATLQDPNAAGTQLQNNGQYNIGNNTAAGGPTVTAGQIGTTQVQAATQDLSTAQTVNPNSGTYTAANVSAAQGTAAQGQVNPLDTVQGQLSSLYSQFQGGNVPAWAVGAVTQANRASASAGLGMSTIGTTAIAQAIQQQAINIAAPDAATYFQMDMQNLSNQQQEGLNNVQNMQQSLLSNQAAQNAASQFNASSTAQIDEFNSNLISTIQSQNVDRVNTVNQFNAAASNTASIQQAGLDEQAGQFNSSQIQALNTFNSQLAFNTQQFNSQNAFAIDQSNVLWQRSVNTANTAATNAANQVNVQNAFNLSTTAMNNLWQEFQDNASYQFTASQNQAIFNQNNAMIANNESFISNLVGNGNAQAVGSLAGSLLGTLFSGTNAATPSSSGTPNISSPTGTDTNLGSMPNVASSFGSSS